MKNLCKFAAVFLAVAFDAAATNVMTFTSSTTWVCPANITAVKVECWGGGGGGGSSSRNPGSGSGQYSGGGAGGAYARLTSYPVTPGSTYYINVGTGGFNTSSVNGTVVAGRDSWVNSVNEPSTVIIAKGGAGGASAIGNTVDTQYGAGGIGTATGSAGDVVSRGGSGSTGAKASAGGGGSSAGLASNGNDATSNIGAAAPAGGGAGGSGTTSSSKDGSPGSAPGGGGSGARDTSTAPIYLRMGGSGGLGKVVLTDITGAAYTFAAPSTPTGNGSGAETGGGGLTIYKGEHLTLTETPAAGYAPFMYAWRKVGSDEILGTNSALYIHSPARGDQYTCAVASTRDGVFSNSLPATITISAYYNPKKVVIIKADDFYVPRTPSHDPGEFIQASREMGIKVGLGIVVNSISGNEACYAWIREQEAFGDVEVWNHGWDHAQWTEGGHTISEFEGSGVDHMRQHMTWCQEDLKEATGRDVCAFGTPYNAFDADCATVMNERPELRLFFSHTVKDGGGGLDPRFRMVNINSEGGGVGHPTLEYAMERLPPGADGPVSFQVHPYYFDATSMVEYRKIIQYLLTNDYSIILPSEYVPIPVVLAAGFSAAPAYGYAPLTVTFTDTSTGAITNRFWNFGDGTTTNTMAASLSHTYTSPGTSSVTLLVSDAAGSRTNIQSNLITAFLAPDKALAVNAFTASGTWVCPAGVTAINVECWGGGGAGGSASRNPGESSTQFGGGGVGGTCAKYFSYPVTPGNTYYINVGQGGFNNSASNGTTVAGGDSWFNSVNSPSSAIIAKGGAGGVSAIGNTIATRYGAGGRNTTNGSAGHVVYTGGRGATGAATGAGGGGSSAGTGSKGVNAALYAGGTAPDGGGNGGAGTIDTSAAGGDGFAPGGGGGGARDASLLGAESVCAGGRGASGRVTLSYVDDGTLVAGFSASPTRGSSPLTVMFTDISTGVITNRFWNFGDGTTTNTTATSLSHTYTSPGTSSVTLIVSDTTGSRTNTQNNLIVAVQLTAGFGASPTSGTAPLTVNFTDISSTGGEIASRFWDFGDGTTTNTTATNLSHTYTLPGTSSVTLIVSDATGSSTNTQSNLIVAGYPELTASFGAAPTFGRVPLTVVFSDTSTGLITNRFWDFGDGTVTNTTATSLAHIYQTIGTNTVALMVSDAGGGVSTNIRSNLIRVTLDEMPMAVTTNKTTFSLSGTWVCPADVTNIQMECWGGGGAGGSASRNVSSGSSQYGGGGAGGAYARYTSYPVTQGNTYYINVGAGGVNTSSVNRATVAGGDTWFNSVNAVSTSILAKGGAGGASAIGNTQATAFGPGGYGTSVGSIGNVVYAGGSGATGADSAAGGGGSSAGPNSAGNSATSNIGATAPEGGGNGGTGPTTAGANGGTGYPPPGGGGSGARDASGATTYLRGGGFGADGQIVLTYTTLEPLSSATAAAPIGDGSGIGGLTTYVERTLIVLTETPSTGAGPFTYAWKKVGSSTVLGTNSTLVVHSPVNGDQYTCDVAATWDGIVSTSPTSTLTVTTVHDPAKVVIIKGDDFVVPSSGSGNFIQASREMGVNVGIGFVVEQIAGISSSAQWMQEQQAIGGIEFWNHGWDHYRWLDGGGNEISEFEGSGLAYMQQHMADAQAGLKAASGRDAIAFGTPYNGFDANCATVINATPELRVFYTYRMAEARSLLSSRVSVVQIISESVAVGMPDAELFKVDFPPGTPGPVALQFHPSNSNFDAARMDEYKKIVHYLLTNGYAIMLPSEFVEPVALSASFSASPTNGAAPLTVTFTDTSSTGSTITNRFWNFGDGATTNTTATSLLHTYALSGTNSVTLIVSDATGSSTNTRSNLIRVFLYEPPQPGTTNAIPFNQSNIWICPAGITSVVVECWGGGGAGGSAGRTPGSGSTQYGGGGAGGAYARYNSYPVTSGNTYYINVGSGGVNTSSVNDTVVAGGDSWFNSVNAPSTVIIAKGGAGGQTAVGNTTTTCFGTGGTGTAVGSIGNVVYAGGSGGTQTASANGYGGSGGGSGGTGSVGNNGNASGTGATAVSGGGNGGNPNPTMSSSGAGQTPTTPPGGGGGGARDASVTGSERIRDGGSGASGRVTLSYVVMGSPLAASFSATPTNGGAPLIVTFTDTSTGTITNRFWSFGDGTTMNVTTTSLTHTYSFPGTNTVQLIVSGTGGSSTNTKSGFIVATSVDTVGDGAPDWWRAQYFGGNGKTTNTDSSAIADSDHDGISNLAEYLADTSPTNAASRLAVTSLAVVANQVRLTWIGGVNANQFIEYCDSLTDTNGWRAVYTNTPPTAVTNTLFDTGAGTVTSRFYRVKAWR